VEGSDNTKVSILDLKASRGRLLYVEEWAKKRRYKDPVTLLMSVTVICIGILLILLILLGIYGLLFAVVGAMVTAMGYSLFRQNVTRMPFKIYEKGFTLPVVDFKKGLKREEAFVHWERLERVTLESTTYYGFGLKRIKFIYNVDKSFILDELEDPFRVMKVLKKLVPYKMDSCFNIYVGPEGERGVVKSPVPLKPSPHKMLISYFMGIYMVVMIGFGFGREVLEGGFIPIFILVLFSSIAFLMFWLSYVTEKRVFKDMIRYRAKPRGDEVEVPSSAVSRFLRRVRRVIPYSEIKAVRLRLEPTFLSHEAEIETVGGERLRMPYTVYEKASHLEEFKRKGFDYVNTSPEKSRGAIGELVQWRLALFLLLPYILLILPLTFSSELPFNLFEVIKTFFILLIFLHSSAVVSCSSLDYQPTYKTG